MLSPDYLSSCADDIIALYDSLNDAIVRDIVRRLVSLEFDVSASAVHQMERIQAVGRMTYDDALREIAAITGKAEDELRKAFEGAGTESMTYDNDVYRRAGLEPLPLMQSPGMLQILTAGYHKCKGELKNLTLTTANTAQTLFISSCNQAYMQTVSGAFSYTAAIQNAIRAIGDSGAWVMYPSGRRGRVDVAVRRSVVTGISQTCGQLQTRQLDDMMWDVVDTTAHMGARASHVPWQGGRFSYKGRNKNYPDFETSTGYGSADGLKGINCRHDFYPAVDGSPRMYSQAQLDEWANHKVMYNGVEYSDYDASQIQRRMERGIRASKRTLSGLDAGIAAAPNDGVKAALKDEFARASVTLKERNAALNDFLTQTERKADYSRTQVMGFGRSISGKASAASKKVLQNQAQSGIMKVQGGKNMNIEIDGFTPCLEHAKTGKIIETSYAKASKSELRSLDGWKFDWTHPSLKNAEIYKLTVKGDDKIQGLIALTKFERDKAVYINIAESAAENLGKNKVYNGVGGHLFAIAAKRSYDLGYGGFMFMDAKNAELVEHYRKSLGATLLGRPHPYRMFIDEDAAGRLLKIYTLGEE